MWSGQETKPPMQGPTSGKDMKGTEVLPEEQGLKTHIRHPPPCRSAPGREIPIKCGSENQQSLTLGDLKISAA